MEYVTSLVLEMEYSPKATAVTSSQETAGTIEDLQRSIGERDREIRHLEEKLQSFENIVKRPQSLTSSPISPIDLTDSPDVNTISLPIPHSAGNPRSHRLPPAATKPAIFKPSHEELKSRPPDSLP